MEGVESGNFTHFSWENHHFSLKNYGTSPFVMGQFTISMVFHSFFEITRGYHVETKPYNKSIPNEGTTFSGKL